MTIRTIVYNITIIVNVAWFGGTWILYRKVGEYDNNSNKSGNDKNNNKWLTWILQFNVQQFNNNPIVS